MKANIIIFSSREALGLAKSIQSRLYHETYAVEIWTDGFFELSKSYIENFSNLKLYYDFAVVLLSDDDYITRRKSKLYVARDNVILELGMCIEAFSLRKTIIVKKNNVSLPSDLRNIEAIEYSMEGTEQTAAASGTICAKIDEHIQRFSRDGSLSWDELFVHTKRLIGRLRNSEAMGGFCFDVLVGINRGGLIISDLIAREYGTNMPILALFADRRQGKPVFDNSDFIIDNRDVVRMLQNDGIKNILVVDSMSRTGRSIVEAKKFLTQHLPDKRVKSAVVYLDKRIGGKEEAKYIDYYVCSKNLEGKQLSLDKYADHGRY